MTDKPWNDAIDRMLTRIQDTAKRVTSGYPHWAHSETGHWTTTPDGDWTGGFWVGILWIAATATGNPRYRALAEPLAERVEQRLLVLRIAGEHVDEGDQPVIGRDLSH